MILLPSDTVEGLILALNDKPYHLLLIGDILDGEWPGDILYQGEMTINYGFSFLYREDDTILPHSAFDDFQREYRQHDALRFLLDKGGRYPRGDLIGERLSTGKEEEFFLKEVDLSDGLKVFVTIADGESRLRVDKVICIGDGAGLPDLLLRDTVYLSVDQRADLSNIVDF